MSPDASVLRPVRNVFNRNLSQLQKTGGFDMSGCRQEDGKLVIFDPDTGSWIAYDGDPADIEANR